MHLREEEKRPSSGSFINFFFDLLKCFLLKKRKTKRWGLYESRRRACNCLTARRRRNKRSSPARDRFRERIRFSSVIRLEESRAKSYFFKYTNQFFDYFCNVLKVSYYFQLAKRSIKSLSKCNDKLFEGCFHILNILNN